MSTESTSAFDRSPDQAFYRSPCQARDRQPRPPCTFQGVVAYAPLYGFGAFDSTSVYGSLVYRDTWPRVYSKLVETWTDLSYYGALKIRTTIFSQYCDIYQTTNTVIFGGGAAPPDSITSTTVTDSLVTVLYHVGQPPGSLSTGDCSYTAQLSGTILDTTATGPFDPADASYGWQALVDICNTMLSATSIPSSIAPDSSITYLCPISTGTGIYSNTINLGTGSLFLTTAAFNGLPVRPPLLSGFVYPGSIGGGYYPAILSIMDYPMPYSGGGGWAANDGMCTCGKSTWILNGKNWANSLGSVHGYGASDHTQIYCEPIFWSGTFTTAVFTPGAVGLAPSYPNPIAVPATVTINTSDVITAVSAVGGSGNFGILGFLLTPA